MLLLNFVAPRLRHDYVFAALSPAPACIQIRRNCCAGKQEAGSVRKATGSDEPQTVLFPVETARQEVHNLSYSSP